MTGTPQRPDPNKGGLEIPIRVVFDEPNQGEAVPVEELRKEEAWRRMRLTEDVLEDYGYTPECPGCRHKCAGLHGQGKHSEACRRRIVGDEEDISRKRSVGERGRKAK